MWKTKNGYKAPIFNLLTGTHQIFTFLSLSQITWFVEVATQIQVKTRPVNLDEEKLQGEMKISNKSITKFYIL